MTCIEFERTILSGAFLANVIYGLWNIFFFLVSPARGHVCIIVNLASKWGKTSVNYTQLVRMHASYAERGLRILGFPCNQFGKQVKWINWKHISCFIHSVLYHIDIVRVAINTAHDPWTVKLLPVHLKPFSQAHLSFWIMSSVIYDYFHTIQTST